MPEYQRWICSPVNNRSRRYAVYVSSYMAGSLAREIVREIVRNELKRDCLVRYDATLTLDRQPETKLVK